MKTNRFVKFANRRFLFAMSLVLGSELLGESSFAQARRRPVPPAPLGSPGVYVGPVANPYGQAPVPIAPAPGVPVQAVPVPGYVTGPVFVAPPAYPPSAVPVRRPSPFDPSAPPRSVPAGTLQPPIAMRAYPEASSTVAAKSVPEVALPAIGNLRLTVTESFLNRLIARDETRPGEVRDFILGAQVSGRQTTATQVRLDLIPGASKAHAALVLNGKTQSATTGVTPQAMVDVASQQDFTAFKEIFFDGDRFSTRHAVVHVRAKNQTLGATTPLTGTLFGGIANRIAYREAERRRPEAEAIARDKVAEKVFPEFDSTVDKQLATANEQLEGTVRRLMKAANLMPHAQQVSTSDTMLSYSAQLATEETPSTSSSAIDEQLVGSAGITVLVHESLLNAFANRAGLKGMKTTDRELKSMLSQYEYKGTGDELTNSEPPIGLPGLDSIVTDIEFDEEEPLRIRLEKNVAQVTMRAKFKPAGQDLIPALELTIPYTTEIIGEKIIVSPGNVRVVSLENPTETDSIAMKMISKGIEASLSKLAIDRVLPASLWPTAGPVPRVTRIVSEDGWGGISVD